MTAIKHSTALHVVRSSALYDLVVTAPFVTPWTLAWVHGFVAALHAWAGAPGVFPEIGLLGTLFANLMGSVVLVWAVVRLRFASVALGRADAAARGLFAVWQVYAVMQGASWLLLGFTAFEIIFLIAQVIPASETD